MFVVNVPGAFSSGRPGHRRLRMIHNHDSLKNPGLLNSLVSRDAGRAQRLRQELPSTGVAPAALLTTPWLVEQPEPPGGQPSPAARSGAG